MKARIIIGANYGDEGKGTVVANYTKKSDNVLNILTNGGSQRGHSILTENGSMTFQHFGAGTYHGADNYFSRYFILNPMQFVKEYQTLIVKPKYIYRDANCRWSTPYDSIANLITEEQKGTHASCCMGIWNTIKRYNEIPTLFFDEFIKNEDNQIQYLLNVKKYYEKNLIIPEKWKNIWNSNTLILHFINDCYFMYNKTITKNLSDLSYDNLIFENGQGLLLSDNGKDTYDTTPSNTGILYSLELLKNLNVSDITAHYVTRPYLTRHGDGNLMNQLNRKKISSNVNEDRTNHYNDFQGEFRYGLLDINDLYNRINQNTGNVKYEIEVTHCDEMDRINEFRNIFEKVNIYDSPLI